MVNRVRIEDIDLDFVCSAFFTLPTSAQGVKTITLPEPVDLIWFRWTVAADIDDYIAVTVDGTTPAALAASDTPVANNIFRKGFSGAKVITPANANTVIEEIKVRSDLASGEAVSFQCFRRKRRAAR